MAAPAPWSPEAVLAGQLTPEQLRAVRSPVRRLLVLAGAGSGKTEVMARRVGWWVGVKGVPRDKIVAFTFTDRAAEELKFRIRRTLQLVTPAGQDATLGGMYVGTIHGFCVELLRQLRPDDYHNYDILDEQSRFQLVDRVYQSVLGLPHLQSALRGFRYNTLSQFLEAYDLLNEYDELSVQLAPGPIPSQPGQEVDWCKSAHLKTNVGRSNVAQAFALSAARYYAYQRSRRFLDFSTSQTELLRALDDPGVLRDLQRARTHFVLDEVQDINPVQDHLVRRLVGNTADLTAVGDHRQAIFGWRGGRVDIMGALYEKLNRDRNGSVVDLHDNFRSTPRIVEVANGWAQTIGPVLSMRTPDMTHGNVPRADYDPTHVRAAAFSNRIDEADWIASAIRALVSTEGRGARHDHHAGDRGLALSDVVILIRTSTDARTYMTALEQAGIPAVFRAGPDLFSQPEVLLMLAVFAKMAGDDEFVGSNRETSLPSRARSVLGSTAVLNDVIRNGVRALRRVGLQIEASLADRLILTAEQIHKKIAGEAVDLGAVRSLRAPSLARWLSGRGQSRRVFPQKLFHLILAEAGVTSWDSRDGRGSTAMFHLGQLSTMIKALETPGWNESGSFKYQVRAMAAWGAESGRVEEAPLRVQPDAVTISTIHGAKGLEYAAVFVADVDARRFPNQRARSAPNLPFDGPILRRIDPVHLADNINRDGERRLMYVAITRAERFLFVSSNDGGRSEFFRDVSNQIISAGGTRNDGTNLPAVRRLPSVAKFEPRLITSFSDLRYFIECPHDFYLRKVLGFAPTIDQAFGYGRGVHNLLRAVHADPSKWAALARRPERLKAELQRLIDSGLFYLRYTVGEPAERMHARGLEIVADYVTTYAGELEHLTFEPEKPFETLIPEAETLISGAIDVIRLDDPPRVTLLDFKSGEVESDNASKLDEDEMRLQVSLYGLAAKRELEYDPEQGLVRYLAEDDPAKKELQVPLDDVSLAAARDTVLDLATMIRARDFHRGPSRPPRDKKHQTRCPECDWFDFCGLAR